MHEIITLQLGQRSNYLATHFWNTQESYFTYSADQESLIDHDIHFRPGIGADGTETFTPRTVIYDLKGGFGSLKKINALYEIEEPVISDGLWNGPAVVQRQAIIQQNPYQQSLEQGLEPPPLTTESVRYWSDFNRVYFHPKSVIQLNEYELNSALMPFENWFTGDELFNSLDKEHDLLDRDLRPFVEEADQMQGIQLMTGVDDAWGGFAARYMDRLRDEYGKTAVWVWGVEDSIKNVPREKQFLKLANSARSVSEIASQASLYIPMTLPSTMLPSYVTIDPKSHWHVSGLLSAAMESMTLPSRLKLHAGTRETLDQITSVLNVNGNQNIAKLRMSVDQKSVTVLNGEGHDRSGRLEIRAQSRDMRIASRERSTDALQVTAQDEVATFDIDFFPTDATEHTRGRQNTKKAHVFGQAENYRGEEDEESDKANEEDEDHERARRRAAGLPTLQKVIDVDEREALSNSLGEIAEAYEEGWDSGSDEDDD
ncbi:dml-1 [Hyphodiscus hymeniophilus]|uniref:Dml-1 n=1 Tax=Hyphodiscus hymeniophilus TaxID=353542 RepID=A0A9P6VF71_9HELO|nr:dml-1 [Hyphodiscus hymeniophilus]